MKLFVGGRKSGKTNRILDTANNEHAIVLTATAQRQDEIIQKLNADARRGPGRDWPNVELVVTVAEWRSGRGRGRVNRSIVIDDLDAVIRELLGEVPFAASLDSGRLDLFDIGNHEPPGRRPPPTEGERQSRMVDDLVALAGIENAYHHDAELHATVRAMAQLMPTMLRGLANDPGRRRREDERMLMTMKSKMQSKIIDGSS